MANFGACLSEIDDYIASFKLEDSEEKELFEIFNTRVEELLGEIDKPAPVVPTCGLTASLAKLEAMGEELPLTEQLAIDDCLLRNTQSEMRRTVMNAKLMSAKCAMRLLRKSKKRDPAKYKQAMSCIADAESCMPPGFKMPHAFVAKYMRAIATAHSELAGFI